MWEFDETEREQFTQFLDIDALFAIDWDRFSGPSIVDEDDLAYFPYRLCSLTLSDPNVQSNAEALLLSLEKDLLIATVTTKAVPFLLQLVSHPGLPGRNRILEALWGILDASRYQIEAKPHLSSYACIDPPEPDEAILLQEVHQMIAEARSLFIEFVASDNTHMLASHILAHFPEYVTEIWPALVQAFFQAEDENIKAIFLVDLSLLAVGNQETCVPWLEEIRLTPPSNLIRFVATIRLPHVTKQNTSSEVIASLIEFLETEPEQLRLQYMQYIAFIGGNSDHFSYDIISALRACDPGLRKAALPVLLRLFAREKDSLQNKSMARPGTIARSLIEFAFPATKTENPITLTLNHEQRQIITTLCAYTPIWSEWRWDTHLKEHGLPDKRENLLALAMQ